MEKKNMFNFSMWDNKWHMTRIIAKRGVGGDELIHEILNYYRDIKDKYLIGNFPYSEFKNVRQFGFSDVACGEILRNCSRDKKTLVVLENIKYISENNEKLMSMILNARHYNLIFICIEQFPINSQPNIYWDYTFLFNEIFINGLKKYHQICSEYGLYVDDYDGFIKDYWKCTKNIGDAMVVGNDIVLRYNSHVKEIIKEEPKKKYISNIIEI